MKNHVTKKQWETPSIEVLDIKKDTFGGSGNANEKSSSEPQFAKPSEGKSTTTTQSSRIER